MAYLQELLNLQYYTPNNQIIGLGQGQAYSSFFPPWETQFPQYLQPNAYHLAKYGYRENEFVYSIIGKRARAVSQAPLKVYDIRGDSPKELKKHELVELLLHPNQNMSQRMFWQVTQIYMDIAGFCAWEVERNNFGAPLRLWPMRPDWCSFLRGQQEPLRAIRYQPWGMPFMDIPLINDDGTVRVIFFTNGEDFDPIYPGVKFFSPTMHALNVIKVDNAMTAFLSDFVQHGAKFAGLLSVAQTLNDTDAEDIKRRWRLNHGGAQNWSDPLVLGLGADYKTMQMNFKDMAFPELDARTESRICNAFAISTIVADARAGLDVATFNNKEQAHKSWHYEWVLPQWYDLADVMTTQALPMYGNDPLEFSCEFETEGVYALTENRNDKVKRGVEMYEKRVAKLNEARQEIGLDPVQEGDGETWYVAAAIRDQQQLSASGDVVDAPEGAPVAQPQKPKQSDIELEAKQFKAWARKRVKEKRAHLIGSFEFKYVPEDMQEKLLAEFGVVKGAEQILEAIRLAVGAKE